MADGESDGGQVNPAPTRAFPPCLQLTTDYGQLTTDNKGIWP
jgi:hypothetical protein